jgi:hypothetical protein
MEKHTISGLVIKAPFAVGSKSERAAVQIAVVNIEPPVTRALDQYVLRSQGGNAYHDPELDQMVGKTVELKGTIHGFTFLIEEVLAEYRKPADALPKG